ncbi:MAG: hypothetical protein SFY70_07150 [Bacteroidia bacterium]|nr:hypothetical protein [Bacteroidia bacterium]
MTKKTLYWTLGGVALGSALYFFLLRERQKEVQMVVRYMNYACLCPQYKVLYVREASIVKVDDDLEIDFLEFNIDSVLQDLEVSSGIQFCLSTHVVSRGLFLHKVSANRVEVTPYGSPFDTCGRQLLYQPSAAGPVR